MEKQENNTIPKVLHYCWFGKGKKSQNIEKCIASWKKYCPDYEIKEWNEENFDVKSMYYTNIFYHKRKWAFVSDYVRMHALYHEGGIYLDTDIEIIRPINSLLQNQAFTGFQDIFTLGCSFIGAKKNNPIIAEFLTYYSKKKIRIILPNLMNKIFKKYISGVYTGKTIRLKDFTIYPKEYFYPYAYFEKPENMHITPQTYTIHYFGASWLPGYITKYVFPLIGWWSKKKSHKA